MGEVPNFSEVYLQKLHDEINVHVKEKVLLLAQNELLIKQVEVLSAKVNELTAKVDELTPKEEAKTE